MRIQLKDQMDQVREQGDYSLEVTGVNYLSNNTCGLCSQ